MIKIKVIFIYFHGRTLHGKLMDIDWKQYKKNLENERKAWNDFETLRKNVEGELAEQINQLRILKESEIERLNEEFKKEKERREKEVSAKIKKAHEKYIKKVEKKFKTSLII